MKTLDQIAEAAGVTKAAIYKRFQSYGLSVNELKAEKQGRAKVYRDDIEQLILLMFQPTRKVETSVDIMVLELEGKIEELQRVTRILEVERNEAKAEKEKAEERAETAEARAERAEAQTEMLLKQIDKLTDAIRAAEAVQAAQMAQFARLPASEVGSSKPGLFERLRARLKGGKKETTTDFDNSSFRGNKQETDIERQGETLDE